MLIVELMKTLISIAFCGTVSLGFTTLIIAVKIAISRANFEISVENAEEMFEQFNEIKEKNPTLEENVWILFGRTAYKVQSMRELKEEILKTVEEAMLYYEKACRFGMRAMNEDDENMQKLVRKVMMIKSNLEHIET